MQIRHLARQLNRATRLAAISVTPWRFALTCPGAVRHPCGVIRCNHETLEEPALASVVNWVAFSGNTRVGQPAPRRRSKTWRAWARLGG